MAISKNRVGTEQRQTAAVSCAWRVRYFAVCETSGTVLKVGLFQWIGLRENLQETIDFPIKYGAFL